MDFKKQIEHLTTLEGEKLNSLSKNLSMLSESLVNLQECLIASDDESIKSFIGIIEAFQQICEDDEISSSRYPLLHSGLGEVISYAEAVMSNDDE
jgi:hypothetical protein